MIDIIFSVIASSVISSVVTRYYFPKITEIDKIVEVEKIVDRPVDRIIEVEKIVEKIVEVPRKSFRDQIPKSSQISTKEERREAIALKAYDPDILKQVSESIKNRDRVSGLIAPNPDAQTDPNWGFKRK